MAPLTTPPRGSEKYERIIMDIIPLNCREWRASRETLMKRVLMSIGFGQYSLTNGSHCESTVAGSAHNQGLPSSTSVPMLAKLPRHHGRRSNIVASVVKAFARAMNLP